MDITAGPGGKTSGDGFTLCHPEREAVEMLPKHIVQKCLVYGVAITLMVITPAIDSFAKPVTKGDSIMKLHSNAFDNNAFIPEKYSCIGADINPEIMWEDVPEGTKSFALSVKDPDAPSGTFVHWLVYDIDRNLTKIEENSIPGKQVQNSFGKKNYGGPCPPSGVHRYYFRFIFT